MVKFSSSVASGGIRFLIVIAFVANRFVAATTMSVTSLTPENAEEPKRELSVFDKVGQDRIWNQTGVDANKNEYPWYTYFDTIGCGGTLITESWVLTAAHCNYKSNGENALEGVEVRINPYYKDGSNPNDTGIIRECEEVFQHPLYMGQKVNSDGELQPDMVNDLTLCKLNEAVTKDKEGNEINPIKLKLEYQEPTDEGKPATAIGLGTIFNPAEGESEKPIVLQEVTLPIIANDDKQCGMKYMPANLCTYKTSNDGVRDGDVCGGDSGGPLFFADSNNEYHQVGIVSFGPDCRNYEQGVNAGAGTWARVSSGPASNNAFEWIYEIICEDNTDESTRDPIICDALDSEAPTDAPTDAPTPAPKYPSKKKNSKKHSRK